MLKFFLVLVATFVMLSNVLFAQDFKAENYLSEKTLLVLEVTNGKKLCEDMRGLGVWKLFEDPQWKEFFKTVPPQYMEMLQAQIQAVEAQAGISLQDLQHAFAGQLCLSVLDVKMIFGKPIPLVLLSWDLGSKKEVFEKFFTETRKKLYQNVPMPIQENVSEVNGYAVTAITTPMPLFLTYMGNTLLLTNSQEHLKSILQGQEENFASLAKSPQYIAMQQKLLQGYEGAYIYLNLKDIVNIGLNFLGPKADQVKQVLEITGLNSLHSFATGVSYREGQVVESLYVHTPEGRRGVLGGILPNIQASRDLLKHLPKNVLGFNHGVFDLQGLYNTLVDVVKVFQPQVYDEFMGQKKGFEERLGVSLEDILNSIGKEYLFSVHFSGGLFPDIAMQWSLADVAKFQEVFGKLLALVPPKYKYNVTWNGYNFTYFNFSTKNQPIPLAPAVCVQDNRLVLTFFPESLKNLLTQEKGSLPKDLLKILKNSNYTVIEYWKFKDIFSFVYRTVVPFLQGMLPRHEIPVEPALLPSADIIEKYFSNTLFIALHDKEGLLWEMYSPTGTFPFAIASGFISYQVQREMLKRQYQEPPVEEHQEPQVEEPQVEEPHAEEPKEPNVEEPHDEASQSQEGDVDDEDNEE